MMAAYRLSKKAAADLDGIHEYSVVNFGTIQAQNYLNRLHERFETLARQPMLGRQANHFAPKLRRYEYRSHVAFYVPEDGGVMIVRVLHKSMDVPRYFIEGEPE